MDTLKQLENLTPEVRELLARKLAASKQSTHTVNRLSHRPEDTSLSMTLAQQAIWFYEYSSPGTSVFNMPLTLHLQGMLDTEILAASINALVQRHEILRTRYPEQNDQTVVEVIDTKQFVMEHISFASDMTDSERKKLALSWIEKESDKSVDIQHDLLFRSALLPISAEEHLLWLNLHHIICDGTSFQLIVDEIMSHYESLMKQSLPTLPNLSLQYHDYAYSEKQWLHSSKCHKHIAYWKNQLKNAPPLLTLPTDYPRPATGNSQGGIIQQSLSLELTLKLKTLSLQEKASPFMVLIAAFSLLLSKLSGQKDIVVGAPVTNRQDARLESLIGLFINPIPFRTQIQEEGTFRELLQQVRKVVMGAFDHQDLPFEKIVEELQPERSSNIHPLFQVMINMVDSLQIEEKTVNNLKVLADMNSNLGSKYDLTLYIGDTADAYVLTFVYKKELFTEVRMTSFLEQMIELLEQVVTSPDAQVGSYSLVTSSMISSLPDPSELLNSTEEDTALDLIEKQFLMAGEREAVRDGHHVWSYQVLEQKINLVASALQSQGICHGDVVAIYAERSVWLAASIIGVWKTGAAVVLLDPVYPEQRLLDILESVKLSSWITLTKFPILPSGLQTYTERAGLHPIHGPSLKDSELIKLTDVQITPEDLAYISFTSGTTGRPKGVCVSHKPLSHFLKWEKSTFELCETDQFSLLSGLMHDPIYRDLLAPLVSGAVLWIPDSQQMGNPGWLKEWGEKAELTVMHLTPSMSRLLTADGEHEGQGLKNLRLAFFGGESLQLRDVNTLTALAPAVKCINFYGTTETPQGMGWYPVESTSNALGIIPLGHGIADVQLLVFNNSLRLTGFGEWGEIFVRTPYLSLGYLDNTQNAERFVINPYTKDPSDFLYRTGDFGRYRTDGTVEYGGRIDQQVKIRGFRIELAEVEAILIQHESVINTAVITKENLKCDQQIIAFVTTTNGEIPTDWYEYCVQQLPSYMIPSKLEVTSEIPLTKNGKVDYPALKTIADTMSQSEDTIVGPLNEREQKMLTLWEAILERSIGPEENFFQVGGHSLSATRLLSRVRSTFKVDISMQMFFNSPTVRGMTNAVEAVNVQHSDLKMVSIPVLKRTKPLRLSFPQQRLWFLDYLEPSNSSYNMHTATRLIGSLDLDLLKESVRSIVSRHESLRTNIIYNEGQEEAHQVITPEAIFEFGFDDLTTLPSSSRLEKAHILSRLEVDRPFDLKRDPLLRVRLIRLDEKDHALIIVLHHIVTDVWSMGRLFEELQVLYNSNEYASTQLPELKVQYADFAGWQRYCYEKNKWDRQMNYWKQKLAGEIPVLQLPFDRSRPPKQTYRGKRLMFDLTPELTNQLKQWSQAEGATIYMTLLGAFKSLLYHYTSQEDILVGSPVANRMRPELENLIGFFVNTLVMRTSFTENITFQELITDVRNTVLGAFDHQDIPFEKLVEELNPERDLSHSPIFQVLFALQNAEFRPPQLEGLTHQEFSVEVTTSKFDLSCMMWENGNTLTGFLEYNTDLFDDSTIERMVKHYLRLLSGLMSSPDQPILSLSLLTEDEQEQLALSNQTDVDYGLDLPLHVLFERQALLTPDAVALSFEKKTLTYEELDCRANQLARLLLAQGVQVESRVGVCMERSFDLVVALLAILKAGGAYVPLDPEYPSDRLQYMLEDASVMVLLTQFSLRKILPTTDIQVLYLDQLDTVLAEQSDELLDLVTGPCNLAYMIYTSGSTGKPKGAMIEHQSIVNRLLWMQKHYGLTINDRILQKTPFSFDVSVWEFFLPLISGACLVIAKPGGHRDTQYLYQVIHEEKISIIHFVPSMLQIFIEDSQGSGCNQLRNVICSGEELPYVLQERFFQRFPNAELHNLYGPTEAAVDVTYWNCRDSREMSTVPIGYPVANTQLHVLNSALRPVPIGIEGVLYIGGIQVGRGYHNKEKLTSERFISDSFSTGKTSRLYNTGDLVKRGTDGSLLYIGRVDHQVKLHGLRIELGEIEACLQTHPAIREAIVLVINDEMNNKSLVTYFVPRDQQKIPEQTELRTWLSDVLPIYMVPSVSVMLDEFPLTPNGKVDRKALPKPSLQLNSQILKYEAPRSFQEQLLVEIWQEVLSVEQIGVQDNFYALGGDSIRSIRIVSKAKEKGYQLAVQDIIQFNTIKQLALQLKSLQQEGSEKIEKKRKFGMLSNKDLTKLLKQ